MGNVIHSYDIYLHLKEMYKVLVQTNITGLPKLYNSSFILTTINNGTLPCTVQNVT